MKKGMGMEQDGRQDGSSRSKRVPRIANARVQRIKRSWIGDAGRALCIGYQYNGTMALGRKLASYLDTKPGWNREYLAHLGSGEKESPKLLEN
jgi:hypothetical protein